ncbi:MAG: cytochrome P450 [Aureispira sp.]|nr:cytochrome P450 [Aureispira sp.]
MPNPKIPHPPRLPFLGNTHQIMGKEVVANMLKVTKENAPIFEFSMSGHKDIYICNNELADSVLTSPHFHKAVSKPMQQIRNFGGDGLFTAWSHEPNWQKAHNILMPGFSRNAILSYFPIMVGCINQLMDTWRTKHAGQLIDIQGDMNKLTFDVIGLCGFDYSFEGFTKEETHPFVHAMELALNESVKRAFIPAPIRALRFQKNKKYWASANYMANLVDEIIQHRKANPDSSKTDFLNLMLQSVDKDTGEQLSDENVRYQIVTFLAAGHETTSGLLSFAFYELLRNPEYLAKAKAEAAELLANGTDAISMKDLNKLDFLRKFLMETLRLYPPVFMFTVYADKDTTIGAKQYPVKEKQMVRVFTYHIHRDKAVWGENADQFDPENFDLSRMAKRKKTTFLAFGSGQRTCIGQHFALMEAMLTICMVLQNFDLELAEGYQFELANNVTLRPKDLKIRVTPK